MGLKGRPNKLNEQKIDNRPSRVKKPIIVKSTAQRIPKPTIELNDVGMKEYKRIYRNLIEAGLYSDIDFGIIQSACLYYQIHIALESSMVLITDRLTITPNGSEILSAKAIESGRCFDRYTKIIVQFGATPLARMRITTKPKEAETEEDKFNNMFGT